jgi:hypothetical protein
MNHKQINHKDQKLSKDMKKQSHVNSKKPSNSHISSEDHLAHTPKKGTHREPNNKKLSSDQFLAKDQKMVHLKEFAGFVNESHAMLTNDEKEWLKAMIGYGEDRISFEEKDQDMMNSISSKLELDKHSSDDWEVGSGY